MRLRLGAVEHDLTTHTLVMGVLGGPQAAAVPGATGPSSIDAVLTRAEAMVGEGADALDVGGVGGGPGPPVGEEDELSRLVPLVEALRARIDVPLSVDTWRSRVVAEVCAAGAAVVHDIGGSADDGYLRAVEDAKATVAISHRRPSRPAVAASPAGFVAEVRAFLAEQVARAGAAGIPDERIVVDAGLGLGKTPAQALTLLRESAALADLGPALLLSASNQRFLGVLLDLEVDERRMASHAAAALGIARGCRIVRAHDVRGARRVADVLEALLNARLSRVTTADAATGGPGA